MRQAVALLIRRKNDKILGVTRGLFSPWDVNLPGGKVEPGESLEEAVIREAREETGLHIRNPIRIYRRLCNGSTDFDCTVFTADAFVSDLKTLSHEGWIRWIKHMDLYRGTFADYNRVMLDGLDVRTIKTITEL